MKQLIEYDGTTTAHTKPKKNMTRVEMMMVTLAMAVGVAVVVVKVVVIINAVIQMS